MFVQTLQHNHTLEDAEDALAGIKNLPGFIFGYIIQTATRITVVSVMSCADGTICRGQRLVPTFTAKDDPHALDLKQRYDHLQLIARCALADLQGVMPEFEPSGDRHHSGWTTIAELQAALDPKPKTPKRRNHGTTDRT